VFSEPKTDRSRRTVPLSPAVVAMLRKHRTEQKAERLRAGNQWQETGLVFTTELGRPVDPRNFLRVVEDAAKSAGVEGVGVHTLRHSAAVGWLEAGCAHQSRGGHARALVHLDHRRYLRPHV
jgi:integrase